jgi:hypothetical protein
VEPLINDGNGTLLGDGDENRLANAKGDADGVAPNDEE